MKKLFFTLCLMAGTGIVAMAQNPVTPAAKTTQTDAAKANGAKFQFTEKNNTHDFGKIPQGVPAKYTFEFKNVGKEPLIISNGQASCGCTTPEWPKEPIMPGKKGKVVVTYNAASAGTFLKSVYLTSNAASETGSDKYELYIKGEVVPAEKK
jgi:archaellum component FlaG (FlaF/FlaG flagellin family)